MRPFFIDTLKSLKRLTGVKQYEDIASNPKGKEAAQIELDELVKPMLSVCKRFPYIPDEDKMRIIKAAIIDSEEFYGINARFVHRALNRVSGKYWKEAGHLETNSVIGAMAEPEPITPETQKLLNEYLAQLSQGSGLKEVPKVLPIDLLHIQQEDDTRQNGQKAFAIGYKPNDQLIDRQNRLNEAIRDLGLLNADFKDLKRFTIESQLINARNLEEAHEIYLRVYV